MKTACLLMILIAMSAVAARQKCFFCRKPLPTNGYEIRNGYGEVLGWACQECHHVIATGLGVSSRLDEPPRARRR